MAIDFLTSVYYYFIIEVPLVGLFFPRKLDSHDKVYYG